MKNRNTKSRRRPKTRNIFAVFSDTFMRGIVTLLPLVITLSVVWWGVKSSEVFFSAILIDVLPPEMVSLHFPGFGIAFAVALTLVIGAISRVYLTTRILRHFENVLFSIPVIKTLYGSIKDFFDFFLNKETEFTEVVMVTLSDNGTKLLGFVTSENPEADLGETVSNTVAVYLPMSYQVGGYTTFVNKEQVEPIDMSVEDALRYVLTAGVSH